MTYTILKSDSREEWLEQRKNYLTATDIATLITGGPKAWERIAESKRDGVSNSFDNDAMRWGRERESTIQDYILTFVDSRLAPNDNLIVVEKEYIAATPDMISDDGTVIAEIKTSKYDWDDPKVKASLEKYEWQIQAQLLVTGAEACVFAWEQHTDYVPHEIKTRVVKPDMKKFEHIRHIVQEFHNPNNDYLMEDLLRIWKSLCTDERQIKNKKDQISKMIRNALGDKDTKIVTQFGSVSLSTPAPAMKFDMDTFSAAHPDLVEKYQVEKQGSQSMRITPTKE